MAEYTIADNGIGIDSEQVEKVFDLFYRLGTKHGSEGEGLELTIVRRILDRQHGSVRIDSQWDWVRLFLCSCPGCSGFICAANFYAL